MVIIKKYIYDNKKIHINKRYIDFFSAESESGGTAEIKKRSTPEEPVIEEVTAKKPRVEAPADVEEPENTLQEKDTFSDISDDADDILNQEVCNIPTSERCKWYAYIL